MKTATLIAFCLLVAVSGSAATLKLPAAPEIELDIDIEDGTVPYPLSAGLLLPAEVRSEMFVVKTSPFDKIKYPIGVYTVDLFNRNMPQVFDKIVEVDSATATGVDVVVEIAIVRFEAKIPRPASNPYTATMVYKVTVTDADGETLLVQTVTGDGQTSKGMMSGFKAKQLAGESAARAMTEAGRQAFEALAEAPELGEVKRP